MKKLKNYFLIVLCVSAISFVFASDSNAQTKKIRNKPVAVKKKIVKKKIAPAKFRIDPNVACENCPVVSSNGDGVILQGRSTNDSSVIKSVSGGVVNGKAVDLVKPEYPPAAKAVKASGVVNIQVTIDEEGNVISANAISGHPLLRATSESAARQSKFSPTTLQGQKVKVTGIIVYNFIAQ